MKSKAALWPIALVLVLAVTVGANGFILYEANRGAAAFEPDYYGKAIRWDSTMAQARTNQRLGWRIAARLAATGELTASVIDSAGVPIAGAAVSVEGFPIAFEDGAFSADLAADAAGHRTTVPLRHAGLHELRFTVTAAGERFTAALRGEPGGALGPR